MIINDARHEYLGESSKSARDRGNAIVLLVQSPQRLPKQALCHLCSGVLFAGSWRRGLAWLLC